MEVSFDGGPNISSMEIESFLTKWGVVKRLSSAYYPKSNGRAEAAVKSMKRAIRGNTGKHGNLNTDMIAEALLQYRNTPLKTIALSPAQLLLGRSLRDGIPQLKQAYQVSPHWQSFIREREKSMSNEQLKSKAYYDSHPTKDHSKLAVGQNVACQNVKNKRWDRRGIIVEVDKFRQYKVKLHGSGRISLRNRIHLKPVLHIKPHLPQIQDTVQQNDVRSRSTVAPVPVPVQGNEALSHQPRNNDRPPENIRRSNRNRKQPERFGEWVMNYIYDL